VVVPVVCRAKGSSVVDRAEKVDVLKARTTVVVTVEVPERDVVLSVNEASEVKTLVRVPELND
jgi:hypothetical protein